MQPVNIEYDSIDSLNDVNNANGSGGGDSLKLNPKQHGGGDYDDYGNEYEFDAEDDHDDRLQQRKQAFSQPLAEIPNQARQHQPSQQAFQCKGNQLTPAHRSFPSNRTPTRRNNNTPPTPSRSAQDRHESTGTSRVGKR